MKAHLKEHKTTSHIHHHSKKTTNPTEISATTESRLIRLVALETTAAVNTKKSRPTTTELSLPVQVNYTSSTTTTTTSTEISLKRHLRFTSQATTTQKPLTQSKEYDTTATSTENPLTLLTERTTTTSTIPVTSTKMVQQLTSTTGKMPIQVEETPDNKAAHITITSAKHINHTTPHAETSEQQSTASDLPVRWRSTTKSATSSTELADKQHLEHAKISSPLQSQPETISTSESSLLKYKTAHLINSTGSTETTFIAESPHPEEQQTQQHLIYMQVYGKQTSTQSRDSLTSSTLDAENDSSVSWNTNTLSAKSVTLSAMSERDDISNHSELEITTAEQLTPVYESSDTGTVSPFDSLTTPPALLTSSNSTTMSTAPVTELSVFTPANENGTSLSTTAAIRLTVTDRSATPVSTTDSIDKESATPTSLLTPANSSGSDIQLIYLLTNTSATTDSTIPIITSTTDGTVITDLSIFVNDDLFLQSVPTVQFINIHNISITTDEPVNTAVTVETKASDSSLSAMSTQHSPITSGETSTATPSHRNQKIILNATVVTG
jgi:hypothetical protein